MGGRNGGGMGNSRRNRKGQKRNNEVVMMPRRDGGKDAEAGGNGEGESAKEKPDGGKATETIEKDGSKGTKKAFRRAVKNAVNENKERIADSLVTLTAGGDMHCAALVMELMEKKKKDSEDDDDWDGPGLADILVPGQLWKRNTAAKQTLDEEEEETKAA
jgi:hypothetical protein